jgi:hypothetical protein
MMPQLDFAVRPQHDTKRSLILSHLAHLEDEHPSGSLVDALCGLSRDPPVQAAIAQSELQLDDVSYYLNVIDRIYDPEYLPSDQEILRCQNSSGITETMLQIGGLTYRLLDVRGTGSMRKWLPCFADVSALVFVAPIDQYDETLPHDPDIVSASLLLIPGAFAYSDPEPPAGCSHALRRHVQLALVCQQAGHPPPRRHRRVRGEAAASSARRPFPRLHRRPRLRRRMRLHIEAFCVLEQVLADETDLCTLHVCEGHATDQMSVVHPTFDERVLNEIHSHPIQDTGHNS